MANKYGAIAEKQNPNNANRSMDRSGMTNQTLNLDETQQTIAGRDISHVLIEDAEDSRLSEKSP